MEDNQIIFESQVEHTIDTSPLKKWLNRVMVSLGVSNFAITYVLVSDEALLEINRKYLDHDYYTDIVTFDMSDTEETVEGDLFVSLDRIKDNASKLSVSFDTELKRVLVHGVLHLVGYDDKDEKHQAEMRKKEDELLSI